MNARREKDVITSRDLPRLRADMVSYLDNVTRSEEFRSACRNAITAIDHACDEDEATHGVLKKALQQWMQAANTEVQLLGSFLQSLERSSLFPQPLEI